MPDLEFQIEEAEAVQFAAVPTISFRMRVTNRLPEEKVHSISLRSQIQLEVTKRKYSSEDQANLRDLFGEPERWGRTLRSMLWTHVTVALPQFADDGLVGP